MSGPRVAIVTGAARGIGAAIATRLAADGYDIAVLDLDEGECGETAAAVRDAGGRAVAVGADVSDESAVTAAVERVAGELAPPTILINNAGVQRDHIMSKMTGLEWDTVMGVQLRGGF